MSLNNPHPEDDSIPESSDASLERDMLDMKLRAEFGMLDSFNSGEISPEMQQMFLQQVYDFEKNYAEGHANTFAESLSIPNFEPWPEEGLLWEQGEERVEAVLQWYLSNQVAVTFGYDYPAAVRYHFLTKELPDLHNYHSAQPGMITAVMYEEFVHNDIEAIEANTRHFMESFFALDAVGIKDVLWRDQISPEKGPYDGHSLIEYFKRLFGSLSGFEKHDFTIVQSGYELNIEEPQALGSDAPSIPAPVGLGYAEGMVGYIANSYIKTEPIKMIGPFKFYFEYREGHWGIIYPVFPGLKIPPME